MPMGQDIKAIWLTSAPRTGSMWTYNIVRDLVRAAGHLVQPDKVPQRDAEMVELGRAGAIDGSGAVYVLKLHAFMPADVPNSRYVTTRRDVCDAMLSYMRFMGVGFEAGLEFIRGAIAWEKYSRSLPADRTTAIDYRCIIERPDEVARRLAQELELDLSPAVIDDVVARHSKEAVAARISQTERRIAEKINARISVSLGEVVVGPRNIARAFDTETGFQSGHVSNYREGDWQDVLWPAQKRRLVEAIAEAHAFYGLD
jgi:hypothetical protein